MFAYHKDDDGTVPEREVQATGNGKLAHIDQPPGCVINCTGEEWRWMSVMDFLEQWINESTLQVWLNAYRIYQLRYHGPYVVGIQR